MEHQCSDLDTLPRRGIRWNRRIVKGRMRRSARSTIRFAVETFNEKYLFGRQPRPIIPFLTVAVLDGKSFAATIWVDERAGHEILFRDRVRVSNGQWVALNRGNGAPHIDYLKAPFEKVRGFRGNELRYAQDGRVVGLVDVNQLHRFAETALLLLRGRATNSMIIHQYTIGTSSILLHQFWLCMGSTDGLTHPSVAFRSRRNSRP